MERRENEQHLKSEPQPPVGNNSNEQSQESNNSSLKYHLTNSDVFSYVVEIAIAAKRAAAQADDAEKRAKYVTELARRARAEAVSMSDVAEGLARTAASVGRVSLEICQFRSFQEAYQHNPKLSQKMNFSDFSAIVQPSFQLYRSRDRNHDLYYESPFYHETFERNQQRDTNNERRDLYRYSENRNTPEKQKLPQDNNKRMENSELRNPFVEKPFERSTANHGPMSFAEYIVRDPYYMGKSSSHSQQEKQKVNYTHPPSAFYQPPLGTVQHSSSEKFVERFPTQLSPVEYKDSLASTFDTCQENMPPLWENRYCEPGSQGPKQAPKPVQGQTEKWSEKKTMKQFQIKLNKYEVEDDDGQHEGDVNVR